MRTLLMLAAAFSLLITDSVVCGSGGAHPNMGPLTVHPDNPRYFADGNGRAVYLTGSHTWDNFQTEFAEYFPVTHNFDEYLDLLKQHNHNFARLWRKELPKFKYPNDPDYRIAFPHPWKRTGPGLAGDGQERFDLTQFDPEFFQRLRDRCIAAGDRGIYVSIMLFEGHDLQFADGWFSHPFAAGNNVNNINADLNGDGKGTELNEILHNDVLELQKAYIRKVVDTVNDLDNVLYEICNEANHDSETWQKHLTDYLQNYQANKPQQHPVILSAIFFDLTQVDLWDSSADAVSPGYSVYDYQNNPPANSGAKVVFTDTDHLFACGGSPVWVWKTFTRGNYPLYMDPFYPNTPYCFNPIESVRHSLGHTRAFAQRVDMAKMRPRNGLASSGYCLADAGSTYIVFIPEGDTVNVNLSHASGKMSVEWFDIHSGELVKGSNVNGGGTRTLSSPLANGGSGSVAFITKRIALPKAGDQFGRSIANAGDVNGDGFDDLVIGAPMSKVGSKNKSGRVYVKLFSPLDNQFHDHLVISGKNGERFGWSVASAGDVNGDGYDDIIVGAPFNNETGNKAGKVYVHCGFTGELLVIKHGEKAGDQFGYAVAGRLNVNGGRDDFIVGAPFNDQKASNAGKVYVFSGRTGNGNNYPLLKSITGKKAGDRFGHSVAAIGRADADNRDDFVVGAPFNDDNGSNAGRVYVFSGKTFSQMYSRKGQPGDRMGWSVSGVGRVNGDNRSDFVVGSPWHAGPAGAKSGRIDVFSGTNGSILWSDFGQSARDLFGYSVEGSGQWSDIGNGLTVGAPQHAANGAKSGRAYLYNATTSDLLQVFDGQAAGERLGWSVATVGLFAGDQPVVAAAGAHTASAGNVASGRVDVIVP